MCLAVGALLQARKMGLRVPEDISITGFDDISLAQVTTPSLTTVRVPQHSMGRKAAEVLLALLNQEPGQNLTARADDNHHRPRHPCANLGPIDVSRPPRVCASFKQDVTHQSRAINEHLPL